MNWEKKNPKSQQKLHCLTNATDLSKMWTVSAKFPSRIHYITGHRKPHCSSFLSHFGTKVTSETATSI